MEEARGGNLTWGAIVICLTLVIPHAKPIVSRNGNYRHPSERTRNVKLTKYNLTSSLTSVISIYLL